MTTRLPSKRGKSSSGGGAGEPPPHPLARAIEQLYAAGATPRLVIDARRVDVVVPDFLRAKWADKLVIDLDAAYPLDLAYDETGLHVSLAFSGVVSRCTFAWPAIYQIIDRTQGRGIVVPAHQPPAELPPELAYEAPPSVTEIAEAKKERKASFSLVTDRDAAPDEKEVSPPTAAAEGEAKPPTTSDEEAKARRAKFRVIEGG